MKNRIILTTIVGLLISFSVSGCFLGKGEDNEKTSIRATTKGQELIDLQKAWDKGIITTEEYEKQRKKILDDK